MADERELLPLEGVERIRRVIHEGQEYWSVVDVVGFLTEAANPSKYWSTMRSRMQSEGAQETLAQIIELPMKSADGRHRKTDAMTRQTLLRLVQSIPSPNNLADHNTRMELILRALGEETATGLHQKNESQGYGKIERDVKEAGDTAADARRAVERRLGEPVVSAQNFLIQPETKRGSLRQPKQAKSQQDGQPEGPEQQKLF